MTQNDIPIIGLTGGSGVGKTAVARVAADMGWRVIDADETARRITAPGQPALTELRRRFSDAVFLPDGSLNRRALGDIVFCDPAALTALNRITHKYIKVEMFKEIESANAAPRGVPGVILDAPLLFESGLDKYCRHIIAVAAPLETRIRRIAARDGLTEQEAARRVSAQQTDAFYTARANFVIENGSDFPTEQVKEILCFIR